MTFKAIINVQNYIKGLIKRDSKMEQLQNWKGKSYQASQLTDSG